MAGRDREGFQDAVFRGRGECIDSFHLEVSIANAPVQTKHQVKDVALESVMPTRDECMTGS